MELPDRIEDMTPAQRMHLDMLVDQVDEETPIEGHEERLAKDPHLAILPSGRKVSTRGIVEARMLERGPNAVEAALFVRYRYDGADEVYLADPHDIAAFNAALNDIGVYVAAPTLKGDDNDGDGIHSEGAPV